MNLGPRLVVNFDVVVVVMKQLLLLASLAATGFVGCSNAEFTSGNARARDAKDSSTNPTPSTPTETKPVVPACTDTSLVTGAHLIIALDNSGSMKETDCPDMNNGQCGSATNREKALLSSYDALSKLYETYKDQASALSTISYSVFTPTSVGGNLPGSSIVALATDGSGRSRLEQSLAITRRPVGDTPYASALNEAKSLRSQLASQFSNDNKPRVVVVITDGEPTDRNPVQVLGDILNFKSGSQVQWITVMVNAANQTKEQRQARHKTMLQTYYERDLGPRQSNGHWYAPNYANFDAYFSDIVSLPSASSDQIIEIDSSDKLQKVLLDEIVAKKVECRN